MTLNWSNFGVYSNWIIPLNINYSLEIDGVQWAIFRHISGGELITDVIQHPVVNMNGIHTILHIPGPTRCNPVRLESGYGSVEQLYDWYHLVRKGNIYKARKNVSLTLNSFIKGKYTPVANWHLINAWPSEFSGIEVEQRAAEEAFFNVTLVCEEIEHENMMKEVKE